MGLIDTLRSLVVGGDKTPEFRCIRCGTDLDKDYHTCPECGGQFVAAVEGESANR